MMKYVTKPARDPRAAPVNPSVGSSAQDTAIFTAVAVRAPTMMGTVRAWSSQVLMAYSFRPEKNMAKAMSPMMG